ncbi:hypothetical protein H6G45_15065 [Synechocystis sp. FACHB-383]|uniref:hypothetical protein n=1 Tax=Synechocystis sp. FACHB-383 TaxID=2692864 RepID=UPI001688DC2D|nr:hypothetical protein [Synechocystis sp. FACHB-383]MBD2654779.1 hypothetical protein [Synechocystis sp. FACHB-383]
MINPKPFYSDNDDFYDDDENYESSANSNSYGVDRYDDRSMDWGYLADMQEEGWWTNHNSEITIGDYLVGYD